MHRRDTASPTSASSGRSKLFLDVNSLKTPATSIATNATQWSQSSCDLVPPKSAALTFAALWDDDRGIITFQSSRGLLEHRQSDYIMVEEENDDEYLDRGYDRDFQDCSDAETFGENESTMAMFQDAFKAFLHRTPRGPRCSASATPCTQTQLSSPSSSQQPAAGPSTPTGMNHTSTNGATYGSASWPRRGTVRKSKSKGTLASSTLDGLNVYDKSHQQQQRQQPQSLRAPPLVSTQYSCFDALDRDPSFQPCVTFKRINPAHADEDAISDEGFYESSGCACAVRAPPLYERQYLKSHFSTTTTSTSNYIEVARFSEDDDYFSSPLSVSPYTGHPPPSGSTPPNSPRKLLRKRRPATGTSAPPVSSHGPHGHSPLASSSTSSESESSGPVTPLDSPLRTPTPSSDKRASPLNYVRRMRSTFTGGVASGGPDYGWVCVEVTPVITQRFIDA